MSAALGVLLRKELRELRRDRRVLFFSLLLPVLLYPLLLGGTQRLRAEHEAEVQERTLSLGLHEEAGWLAPALRADSTLTVIDLPPDSLAAAVRTAAVDVAVAEPPALPALGDSLAPTLRLWSASTREASREGARRVREHLDGLRETERRRRAAAVGDADSLLSFLAVSERNVARAAEEGGARAGGMVIYLLLMILYMAGSVLATDTVAGEKERGTLETLFLAPVDRELIARAKMIVVSAGTAATGLLCLVGLGLSYGLGWVRSPDGEIVHMQWTAFLAIGLLTLPLGALIGSVLLAISTWSRSLKEAQTTMVPVMLLMLVPALLSMQQSLETTTLVAILPVANVAFLMRDVLGGQVSWPLLALGLASTLLFLWWALRKVSSLLEQEELVLAFAHEPVLARTPGGRRRGLHLGMAIALLAWFYVGQGLQSWRPIAGLALSLWVLLPLLGVGALALGRLLGEWRQVVVLARPPGRALLGAVLLGWGSILPLVGGLQALSDLFLPAPTFDSPMTRALEDMGLLPAFLMLALSPAVVEELFFRGICLGGLRRLGADRRVAIGTTALWFALMHMSVHRFLLTFTLGWIMGALVWRQRTVWVSVVFHLAYNGALVVGTHWLADHPAPLPLQGGLAWALSAALLVGGFGLLRRSPRLRAAGSGLS